MIYRDTLTVVDVIIGGPSEGAGLEIRDRIVKINSENIAGNGLKNEDVLKKLKGKLNKNGKIFIIDPHGAFHLQAYFKNERPYMISTEYNNKK